MIEFRPTASFQRQFDRLHKKYRSLLDDYYENLKNDLRKDPRQGAYLGNALRKVCMAIALILSSCHNQSGMEPECWRLDGVWMLRRVESPVAEVAREYPHEGHTDLYIYGPDSAMYVCGFMTGPSGQTVVPSHSAVFTLIDKGGGEHLYFEDGEPRPLTVVNDSTITIQRFGTRFTMVRYNHLPPKRVETIRQLVEADDGSQPRHYVFSEIEEELKAENSALSRGIAGTIALLLAVAFFAREAHRHRKSVERQLEQLRCERENRPQLVAQAMKSVEDEFFASGYCLSVLRKISAGRLTEDEWGELEQHINSIYTGFSGKLSALYRMLQTERRVCLLIKLRVPPSEMAAVLCKDVSTVSTIRRRLFHKVFSRKGSAKEWDEFIASL